MTGASRYKIIDGVTVCEDCGAVITVITMNGYRAGNTNAHDRFHAALPGAPGGTGWIDVS